MSDLDKAIRDAVAFGRLPLTGRFEAAFAAVLDLHAPQALYPLVPDDVRCAGCSNHVVRVDYPCATVRAIGRELRVLGVSGEDRSKPTPAPRTWHVGGDETEPTEPGLKILGSNGVTFERTSYGRWRALPPEGDGDNYGWSFLIGTVGLTFTEVVTPEDPA